MHITDSTPQLAYSSPSGQDRILRSRICGNDLRRPLALEPDLTIRFADRFSCDTFAIEPVATNCGGSHMRRREFIALLGGAAVGWPLDVLASVGDRSALERTARFFMQLVERRNLVGPATEIEFKCPLSQYVLRQLRERGILALRGGSVKIHDLSGLRRLAGSRGGDLNARG